MLLKPGIDVFDQEWLIGIPWNVDVRMAFGDDDEKRFLDIRERCAVLFGEVGPAVRDEDDAMFNDMWFWSYREINKKFRKQLRSRFEFQRERKRKYQMVIVLRYWWMALELGIDLTHLTDRAIRVAR